MFKRAQFKELFSRILEPRDKIQVISGPRQVGKSTLVKQVLQFINEGKAFYDSKPITHVGE